VADAVTRNRLNLPISMAQMMQTKAVMRTFALGVLSSLVLVAQGFAVIRSPYPVKTMPPYYGRFIIIGDDARSQTVAKSSK